jgi:hypothetical protein
MGKKLPGWQQFERDLQGLLGLDATICSGNQFQDPGDAVDNTPPADGGFKLLVDCKYTESNSYSLNRKTMQQWVLKGVERGKRAIMVIRMWPRGMVYEADYVILPLDDFHELLELAKERRRDIKVLDKLVQDVEPWHGKAATGA